MIVSNDGTEPTSNPIVEWQRDHGDAWRYIAPGKPMQNSSIEFFKGRLGDGCLNEHVF